MYYYYPSSWPLHLVEETYLANVSSRCSRTGFHTGVGKLAPCNMYSPAQGSYIYIKGEGLVHCRYTHYRNLSLFHSKQVDTCNCRTKETSTCCMLHMTRDTSVGMLCMLLFVSKVWLTTSISFQSLWPLHSEVRWHGGKWCSRCSALRSAGPSAPDVMKRRTLRSPTTWPAARRNVELTS